MPLFAYNRVQKKRLIQKNSAKTLSPKGSISTLAIQAFKTFGQKDIKAEEGGIMEKLKREDKQVLQHVLNLAPALIRELLQNRKNA